MASQNSGMPGFDVASASDTLKQVLSQLRENLSAGPQAATEGPIRGGPGDDVLDGTEDADVINAGPGNDVIDGQEGDDLIRAGSGDDEVVGGEGDDTIQAGSGDDEVDGGEGDDLIVGGSGDDSISGGEGNDVIRAGSGDDVVDAGEGDDTIGLGSGSDTVVFSADFGADVIEDFRPGEDVIDLTAFGDITSLDQLTFTEENGSTVITAPGLSGSITVRGATADELRSGSSIEVACYLRGTMILTATGERPVEELQIGDEVLTVDGVPRPVRWLGHRSFSARFLRNGSRLLPVTIRAGALGENLPNRDLSVSPGHSMLVEGKLVNADLLLNGVSVVRAPVGETIDYIHIELDSPDAVIANGAPSETYVNDANRRQFENWASYVLRYGEDSPAERNVNGLCVHRFPHIQAGAELEALRARLNHRANSLVEARKANAAA